MAERIGDKYFEVGNTLLNDSSGSIVRNIVSHYTKQINTDILRLWVEGKGINDRTWRGLIDVLGEHCPQLAQDIEKALTSKKVRIIILTSLEGTESLKCLLRNYLLVEGTA